MNNLPAESYRAEPYARTEGDVVLGSSFSSYRPGAVQKAIVLTIGISLGLWGCAARAPRGYLKPGVTAPHIKSIAVLPFDNISGHPDAGKKVLNLLLTELARTELFDIAEVGEVEKVLRSLRVRTAAELDLSKLQELGDRLDVEGVIVGSVDEYDLRQGTGRSVPVVAISARMLEAQPGDILWVISHMHDGDDWATVFGFGRIISLSELAQVVVSEVVEFLVQGLEKESEVR